MNDVLEMLITGIAIETAMATTSKIHDLMVAYKKNNIDVVPISELEKAFSESCKRAREEGSFTSSLVKRMMKGDLNV